MFASLRPYQYTVFTAVMNSVLEQRGLTFSVEIARQGGKNEISAHLEMALLVLRQHNPENLVKCSPSFRPQAIISLERLKNTFDRAGYAGVWVSELGYIVRFGKVRAVFLSAAPSSRVVGHTAHILLEVDEAQDVNKEKFVREFKPMGATTNCTTVLYGTAWDSATLLEEMKQANLEQERKDGLRRHFRFDWQEVAQYNPAYRRYVEVERQRLGANHPLFLTQYCLTPVRGGDGFLSAVQRAQLQGSHPRLIHPEPGKLYIAGIDLAGEAEQVAGDMLAALHPRQDATLVTIGEIIDLPLPAFSPPAPFPSDRIAPRDDNAAPDFLGLDEKVVSTAVNFSKRQALIRVVAHYRWTGIRHSDLYPRLVDLLQKVWRCRRIVVDATGIGQPVASFLKAAIGRAVVPFTFTVAAKSLLGFNLLAAVNSGNLKMYAADGSPEYREFWHEMELARSYYRPNQTVNFYVDPSQGHDDYLMSLALLVEAGRYGGPRVAHGLKHG